MYRVKETFEYLVDDSDDFCSVHDALEMDSDMPCWDGSKIPIGGEERSIPWGDSVIEVINNAISIDVDTLLQLIKDSEKLAALEAEGDSHLMLNWLNELDVVFYEIEGEIKCFVLKEFD